MPPDVAPISALDRLTEKGAFFLLLFLILLVQLFVYSDFILFRRVYLFTDIASDSYNLFYPGYVHIANYLRAEGIPTWSFAEGMGENIFSGGIHNPFHLILYLIGPQRLAYGIVFVEMLKGLMAGILFFLYLRLLGLNRFACLSGGVMAAFTGYLVLGGSGWYGHSTNVVYFLFLVYAFELYFQRQNWMLLPAAVFFVATDPFKIYIFGLFMLTYVLFRLAASEKYGFTQSLYFLLKLTGLSAIGIGMSMVFSINSLLNIINSPRISGDVSASGLLSSVQAWRITDRLQGVTALMRTFSADMVGTGSGYRGWYNYLEGPVFYAGVLPLLLFPQVFVAQNRRRRIILAGFILFWAIPLVFPYFRYALYAFMGNYYKHGLSLFIPFIILMFGMYGLQRAQHRNASAILLLTTAAILLVLLYYPWLDGTAYEGKHIISSDLRIMVSILLLVYTGLIIGLGAGGRISRYAGYLLIAVICIEAGFFSHITANDRATVTREQLNSRMGYNDHTLEAVDFIKGADHGFYRINKVYSSTLSDDFSLNDAKAQGFYGTTSYSSFNKQEYIEFLKVCGVIEKGHETKTRWSLGLLNRPLLQAMASVNYTLVHDDALADMRKSIMLQNVYKPIRRFGDITLLKNGYALPFGFTYDSYIPLDTFCRLPKIKKDIALMEAFVSEKDFPGFSQMGDGELAAMEEYNWQDLSGIIAKKRAESFHVTHFSEKRITGEIDLPAKKLLFFSIPYDSGWQARDN